MRLQPQPTKVLCLLVERAGNLVSRVDIQKALWQDETFVDFDQGLNYCIRQIRVALEDSAEQPMFVVTVPRRGYRFVAEVSTVPFSASPSSIPLQPVTSAIEQPSSPSPEPVVPVETRPRPLGIVAKARALSSNRVFIGTLAILLVTGVVYFGVLRKHLAKTLIAASAPAGDGAYRVPFRTSIAVLGFANLGGKESDAWLSTALSEMFSTELSEGGKLRLVSAEEVAKARPPVQLPESLSPETLGRLRQELGADVVVFGSYAVITQNHLRRLRLDLRLQDARDGQILAAFAQTRDEADLFELVSSAGTKMRQNLGVGGLSPAEEASFDQSFPSDPDVRRLYAEGLERQRRSDALGARELLEKVVGIEPRFAPAHSALAAAWSTLGYDEKATAEARTAKDLTSGMPREEQLSAEARYYEMAKDRAKATETLRALVSFFPDNIDYGIRLATVQMQDGKINDALSTVATLRKLPGPLGASPRLDLLEAQVRNYAGNYTQARDLADNGIRKAMAMDARFMVAETLSVKSSVLERLGQLDAALEAASEMRKIETEAQFPRGIGVSLLGSGDALSAKTDYERAREQYEAALAIFRQIGSRKDQGLALERIGNIYLYQGKFVESQKAYTQALVVYREVQWPMGVAAASANVANAMYSLGDLKGALRMHQQTLQTFQQMGYQRAVATEIDNIAVVQGEMGDLPASAQNHRKAIEMQKQAGNQRAEMFCHSGLGDVLLAQGDLAAAVQQYETARALAQQMKEESDIAQIDVSLARIYFYQQRFADAENLIRRSVAQLEKDKDAEHSSAAYALLSQDLLAEHRLAEAVEASKHAAGDAEQTTAPPAQFEVSLALTQLESADGKKDLAFKRLRMVLQRASKDGYEQYVLEARRALIGLETGKARTTHLAALSQDAKQKGFGLIGLEIAKMSE